MAEALYQDAGSRRNGRRGRGLRAEARELEGRLLDACDGAGGLLDTIHSPRRRPRCIRATNGASPTINE